MRKQRQVTIPRISCDNLAAQLKRGLGKDRAQDVAERIAKELKGISTGDVNADIFSMKDIRKGERIWTQVANILANQKGFTLFELIFCLAILGVVVLGILEIGVIAHFVSKFW